MKLLTTDLPFLMADEGEWVVLPNGIEYRLIWEYSLTPVTYRISLVEQDETVVAERVTRQQHYRWNGYHLVAGAATEWRYIDHDEKPYAEAMLGYRGYWMGETCLNDEPTLQPEVAILLSLTPDLNTIPPFIETASMAELDDFLAELQDLMRDDDALAFSRSAPIGSPPDAPPKIEDALRRMRAQTRILTTRGRVAMLEQLMAQTGIVADNGGWRVIPEEINRRKKLGLR